jgi:hypothetical protein
MRYFSLKNILNSVSKVFVLSVFLLGFIPPVSAQESRFCFTPGQNGYPLCYSSQISCNTQKSQFESRGGVVSNSAQSCSASAGTEVARNYPMYCFGTRGLNNDACFRTRSDCQRAQSTMNSTGQDDTQCLRVDDPTNQEVVLENPLRGVDTIFDLFNRIMNVIVGLALPIAFVMLVWTGFQFVLAEGNSEKLKSAKKLLLYVMIGLVLILSAKIIASILASSFYEILGR